MHINQLRKRKDSGELYTRRPPVTDFIEKSIDWPFDELLRRAAIRDRRHSDHVPAEVLVYHLRQTKSDNSDGRFVALYDILRDRVEAACPRPNRHVGDKVFEDSRIAEIRDATIDHVTELMFTDRQGYDAQLDIYEVVFDKAVQREPTLHLSGPGWVTRSAIWIGFLYAPQRALSRRLFCQEHQRDRMWYDAQRRANMIEISPTFFLDLQNL